MPTQQQKNGIRLSVATLITAVTAVVLCVAAFTNVRAMAKENRADIVELKTNYEKTAETIQKNAVSLAVITSHMGIDPNTD